MVTALNRVPEPAVEDASAEAEVYDKMDHTAVNEAFCVDLLAAVETAGLGPKLHDGVDPLRLLDVGTGTARIPIMLARRPIFLKPIVVEPDEAMLNRARLNMYASGLQANIDLRAGAAGSLEFEDGAFDAVMSNSVLHHMDDVTAGLADMVRVLRPGGLLFVRDLARPASEQDVTELVTRHASSEPEAAKTLLEQSLRAAYTPDEITEIAKAVGLPDADLVMSSDRHWTLSAVKPG